MTHEQDPKDGTTLPPSGDTPAELAEHLASGARLVEAFHLMPGVARAMREAACLLRELSAKMIDPAPVAPCIGNDPACPCQDGELCHYKDSPDGKTKAMPVPPAPDIGDWVWGWLADYCKRNGIPAAQSDLFALCSDIRKVYPAAPAPATVEEIMALAHIDTAPARRASA